MSRVAFLIPTLDRIGGAERQLVDVAKALSARGWHVSTVALSGAGGTAAAELAGAGVDFANLEMRRGLADPRGWLRFNRWLGRERPEIVHAHLPHAAWMARWSRLAAPARVVIDTVHTSATGTRGRRLGYRWSRWLPDRVTAVGEAVRDAYVGAGMATADQICVIPNGIDTGAWRPDETVSEEHRKEMGFGLEFVWFAAGRLEAVKDYTTMLRAFAETPESGRLVIAGTGAMEGELRSLSAEVGIGDRVRFLGFEPNVRRWMQAADAFVLSSRWEGLPMALIEAAACGLPAVATDVPGTREVVKDGETGWLARAGAAASLAEKMQRIMRSRPEERRAMGATARQLAIERFSLAKVLDRWEALYGELLERNPNPRRWAARK